MVTLTEMLLVASPAFPGKNLTDVIAIAKQKAEVRQHRQIDDRLAHPPCRRDACAIRQYRFRTFVPYDSGAQAIPDVMANRVDLAVGAIATMLPQVRRGALKALAVTSSQRSPLAPDIPTSAEAGLPELQLDPWFCIMTTGGTPAPVIARLDEEIATSFGLTAKSADAFAKQGVEIYHMGPLQLGAFLRSDAVRFQQSARAFAGQSHVAVTDSSPLNLRASFCQTFDRSAPRHGCPVLERCRGPLRATPFRLRAIIATPRQVPFSTNS